MNEQRPSGWQIQKKPVVMTRRYEFSNYFETRTFLDHLAQLSEEVGYFPDMNFARTYVNVSVTPHQGTLGPIEYGFAESANILAYQAIGQVAN